MNFFESLRPFLFYAFIAGFIFNCIVAYGGTELGNAAALTYQAFTIAFWYLSDKWEKMYYDMKKAYQETLDLIKD